MVCAVHECDSARYHVAGGETSSKYHKHIRRHHIRDPIVRIPPPLQAKRTSSLMNYSFAFLGSLIYSNVIFHRHRRNKRHRVTGTAITPNPYYNGPFSETGMGSYQPVDGISTHEQPVNSAYPFTPAGTETLAYSGDGVISPLLKKDGPAQGQYVGELPAVDRKGGAKESAMELSAAPEVYELSDTRGNREREDAW